MPAAEVVYWLRKTRYDLKPRIPLRRLAAAAGLHWTTVYRAMNSGEASEETCVALTPLLRRIAAGEIGYQRRGRQWSLIELHPPIGEAGPVVWQDKLVRAGDWQPGRCRVCGGQRYNIVRLPGGEFYACDGCIGEADRQMLGAQPRR